MIKGAENLLTMASEPIKDIQNSIEELESEKQRLTEQLDTSDNQFSMEVVKKNKAIESDIHQIENTLKRAKQRKEELLIGNADNVYNESKKLLKAFKDDLNDQHKADNQRIISMIDEVRAIYQSFKEEDKKHSADVADFIDKISPYLDPRNKAEFGAIGTQENQLNRMNERQNMNTYLTWLEIVREDFFKIGGLITDFKESSYSQNEREKYSTDSE
ncbi:hypothetical protein [Alkalibacterium olivapovliticus]|uniref:Uncharacterized protein n=1 Tax=Alkalibacterium olivapovliticus TaxID=99907 RepID=A0A2T0W5G5_9LACT|nr:hypothetical protein [Alkalibacterium olivapovliticus]PRY81016.1 hypothetical protein CLV38_11926 [Alkalibacterium olivapovliticus]